MGITDRAGAQLKHVLEQKGAPAELALRYSSTADGAELRVDAPDVRDHAFEYDGRVVLIVDPDTARRVEGRQLDFSNGAFSLI